MSGRHITTILCVDDNTQLLTTRKQLLESRGYRVFTTNDVQKALTLVEREPLDAVILDYRMQPIDGEGAALGIRARKPALPIILLSGFPTKFPEYLLHLVDAFVPKGEPAQLLVSAIESAVGGKPPKKPACGTVTTELARARRLVAQSQRIIGTSRQTTLSNISSIEDYRRRGRRHGL